jgi:hypothetical protein
MLLGPTGMERQALTKRTPTPGHAAAEGAADGTAAEYPGQTHHHGPWCYDDEHQDVQRLADPDGTVGPDEVKALADVFTAPSPPSTREQFGAGQHATSSSAGRRMEASAVPGRTCHRGRLPPPVISGVP